MERPRNQSKILPQITHTPTKKDIEERYKKDSGSQKFINTLHLFIVQNFQSCVTQEVQPFGNFKSRSAKTLIQTSTKFIILKNGNESLQAISPVLGGALEEKALRQEFYEQF